MKKILLSLTLLILFLSPSQTFALSCEEPLPLKDAYNNYEGVVIGTVEHITESSGKRSLIVQVDKSFKGVDQKFINVEESLDWGVSQLNFSYLFFLNADGNGWEHPLCSPSTNNIILASQEFADKESIDLTNNGNPLTILQDNGNKANTIFPLIGLVSVLSAFGFIVILFKKRKL